MSRLYKSFTLDSPRAEVLDSLDYITTEPPYSFSDSSRTEHIEVIMADLQAIVQGSPTRLRKEEAAPALLSIKTLGKVPHGAGVLAKPENLKTLLDISILISGDDSAAWAEAWRTVANTLLQNDGARTTWISDTVGGGGQTAKLIATSGLEPERIFLLCRVLFLSSLSLVGPEGAYVKALVNEHDIVSVIASRLDELATAMTAGAKMSREATSEALKFIFNVLHLYPKIAPDEDIISPNAAPTNEDAWDPKLDGILPPLIHLLTSSTPTVPSPLNAPMTHIIHALIAVPASPTLLPLWFNATPASSPAPDALSASGSQARSSLDGKDSKESPKEKSKPSRFDRALSVLSRGSSKSPQPARTPPPNDAFDHLRRLLDFTLAFYLPAASEPDDAKTRERAGGDGALDDALAPLTCVIARLCKADARARARISGWLWPTDLDRSTGAGALESRPDALGRCLRLLQSVYHSRTKDGVGEMLYAAADSDPSTLTNQVGYGNVAGLLYAKGILSAPTPSSGSSSGPGPSSASATPGPAINPITGVAFDPKSTLPEMTEEEKEQEAEKLFVLFDRLERSGAIKPEQNPVRDAMRKANS